MRSLAAIALIGTSRPWVGVIVWLICLVGFGGGGLPSWTGCTRATSFAFVVMAGFVINDVMDMDKDKRAERKKPIAQGTVSPPVAICYALLLITVALGLAATHGPAAGVVTLGTLVGGLVLYSPLARALPLMKGVLTAALVSTLLCYISVVGGPRYTILHYALLTGFITARELILDAGDIHYDRRAGARTIAVSIGEEPSYTIGWLGMLACGLVLVVQGTEGVRPLALAAVATALISWFLHRRMLGTSLLLTRWTVLFGGLGLVQWGGR